MSLRAVAGRVSQTSAPTVPTVTASPYTYTNASAFTQQVIVNGGTVTQIQIVRAATPVTTGLLDGVFILNPGDGLTITYSIAPTVTTINLL